MIGDIALIVGGLVLGYLVGAWNTMRTVRPRTRLELPRDHRGGRR